MSEVVIPTTGRAVHYFTKDDFSASKAPTKKAEVVSATVQRTDGLNCDLSVLTLNEDRPVLVRLSVPHKSQVDSDANIAYWDWPEKK